MNVPTIEASADVLLKDTTGKCPVCRKPKPAKVFRVRSDEHEHGKIVRRLTCPCHGDFETLFSSDARFYWLAKGDTGESRGPGCGCGTACSAGGGKEAGLGSNATDASRAGVVDKLATCLALIEVTDSCNMACPTCFADSPVGVRKNVKYHPFDLLVKNIQGQIDRKGKLEILQLSGGEPTIHPEFFRLVEWIKTNPMIDYLLINTNGIEFAKNPEFMARMGEAYKRYGKIQLYLQFDGPQEEGQLELRGMDPRSHRQRALENCALYGIPVTLAMTVFELNIAYMYETVKFGLGYENVRGVSFQPKFLSGRIGEKVDDADLPDAITVADIIHGINRQSGGKVSLDDFTSLPCGDPNCTVIGWIFRLGKETFSPAAFGIDVAALQKTIPDKLNYDIEDLAKCGCDDTVLGDLMKKLELRESNAFRLLIKPFMDERTWDQHRIDRCCTHVIRPDGELDSFCRYYARPPNLATCC